MDKREGYKMKNILLVEDGHSIASLVKEYLTDKGYHLAWSHPEPVYCLKLK
jgi:CheY-like chemotaxis protein